MIQYKFHIYKKIILFFLFSASTYSQNIKETDYTKYHEKINKAEIFFFKEKNIDSTVFYYEKVFNNYDFIFLKDLITCAQIAKHSNKPFIKYIEKGFEFGLKIEHLKNYPIFGDISKLEKENKLKTKFDKGRKLYLKKIDFNYLDLIYDIAVEDQCNKYLTNENEYIQKKKKNMFNLKKRINSKGFPGERLLGIADSTICDEVKLKNKDLKYRIIEFPKAKTFDEINESCFAQIIIFPFFMHFDYCFFKEFDSKQLINEIKKGNIHPRDIAFFNDVAFTTLSIGNRSFCKENKTDGFYFSTFSYEKDLFNIKTANKLRENLFMVPYEIDIIKQEYEKNYGFNIFYGYSNYR